MRALAIIPARIGSKRIPHKNLQLCGGRPLIDWSIKAVNESSVTQGILSSDSDDILAWAWGKVIPLGRSPQSSTDTASTEMVMAEVLEGRLDDFDVIVLLQPTSPLTTGRQINEALSLMDYETDSVISVTPLDRFVWTDGKPNYDPQNRPRSQEFVSSVENGAIYITTVRQWQRTRCRLGGRIKFYNMGYAPEIDTWDDLNRLQRLFSDRIAVDLDGTLCDTTNADYLGAQAIPDAIQRVRQLKAEGRYIIIYTARGATTGIDWRHITERQLEEWGVPYDELTFNKPTAGLYIDDKAMTPDEWRAWQ